MAGLHDVLQPGLDVVFCGTAAGETSARVGIYYAGRGNQFWAVLARMGLTPAQLGPEEYGELPLYGIGLTDLAKKRSGSDAELTGSDFDVAGLRKKIEKFAPAWIAFNGKEAAKVFFDRSTATYGRQLETIDATAIFVLPSTSGSARRYWDASYWRQLAKVVKSGLARRD